MSLLFWVGCDDRDRAPATPPADTWDDVCIDDDGDGRGFQCADGDDCNDSDPAIFENCKTCSSPSEGCECAPDTKPVDCTVSKQVVQGSLLCKSGTRYCRDGEWSGCEGVKTFEAPPPSNLLTRSLIDPDAGARICDVCAPDCYRIEDILSPDASYGDSGIVASGSGGITLGSYRTDSGVPAYEAGLLDECRIGDEDCDGFPDEFDPFPDGGSPFASDHNTIFMDLGPGDTQEESFSVRFFLNTADIYFYLDMTGSMGGERSNLISSLRAGNFLPADRLNEACSDRNLNGRTDDEEYLKDAGIAGNLACLIRDSRIGAGWHRDLPFPRPDPTGFAFGPHDFEAFQHEQDITDNVDAVLAGLNRFGTRGGINRPEGGIVGLYALATGSEQYFGWNRPGNPARTDCPAGTWGYPCFREEAVPIVIWVTDAPIVNGPAPIENRFENASPVSWTYGGSRAQPVNWDPSALVTENGSDDRYNAVGTTHETFATALDLGDINNSFRTYTFNSKNMRSDITYAALTGSPGATYMTSSGVCASNTYSAWSSSAQTAPDAVFKIRVTENEPITISTAGSRVQSAIAIVDAKRIDGAQLATPSSSNFQPSNPAFFGGPVAIPGVASITGVTAGTALFSRDSVGCLSTGSSDKIAASVVRFNLQNDAASLRIATDASFAASTSLFAGRPGVPASDVSLGAMTVTTSNVTRSGNASDVMNTYNVGNLSGAYRRFTVGTTDDADLTALYPVSIFTSAPPGTDRPIPPATTPPTTTSCVGASGTAKDAVYEFSLSAPTRLRIEGTGVNGTQTAGLDHMIGLVSRGVITSETASNNFTDTATNPAHPISYASIPSDPYSWVQFNGATGGSTNSFLQYGVGPFTTSTSATACTSAAAAASNSLQAVFTLVIPTGTATQSYEFDTGGSSANTWLSLHQNHADTQDTVAAVNTNSQGAVIAPQALGAMDETSMFVTAGSLSSSSTAKVLPANFGAGCTANGKDAVYTFTVSATQQIQVNTGAQNGTAPSAGNPAFNTYVGVFAGLPSLLTKVAGGCDNPSGVVNASGGTANANAYQTAAFTANPGVTYYVVVKASSTTSAPGSYGLWIRDTTHAANFLACDYGSQANASSYHAAKITRSLGPGTYFLVVKSNGTSSANYQLRVRRSAGATNPTLIACDRNSGGTRHSVIDRTLPAGHYSLIVRGYGNGTFGTYDMIMRDMGYAPAPVACGFDNVSGGAPPSFTASNLPALDSSGTPIDYYLVVRGDTGTGSYNVRIEDANNVATTQCAYDNVTMSYSQASPAYSVDTDINNAEWNGTLPVGEYYVVLKGYNASDSLTDNEDNDWGQWQFTVGDRNNFQHAGTFDAKRWLGPTDSGAGGVLEALNRKKVRVIMVDSTDSPTDNAYYSDQQGKIIARATDAVALDGSPLFYKINEDGTGLGTAIVDAVNTLAGNLAMDVGVRFVEAPDSPAPKHFNFKVEAVDSQGDSCSPPIDTDGDPLQLPDTHVRCRPGATPLFKISISNPLPPYNVPTNFNDPQGGWNMRIDLIADGQYVVDQIPVYIIPEDVVTQPGEERYDSQGTYQDTVPSNGCVGNEAPKWGALSWTGSVPFGTSLIWNLCTADTEAELDQCTPRAAAAVSTSNSCLSPTDCAAGSFCNGDSVCESRVGPRCSGADQATADAVCGVGGSCVAGFCTWLGAVDVKPALPPGSQGKRFARVHVTMNSNAAQTRAPTINSWRLDYTCSAQE